MRQHLTDDQVVPVARRRSVVDHEPRYVRPRSRNWFAVMREWPFSATTTVTPRSTEDSFPLMRTAARTLNFCCNRRISSFHSRVLGFRLDCVSGSPSSMLGRGNLTPVDWIRTKPAQNENCASRCRRISALIIRQISLSSRELWSWLGGRESLPQFSETPTNTAVFSTTRMMSAN